MQRRSAAVIGAGVVGLATARALAQRGLDVTVLEKGAQVANETSARNSGVIHGGMYYPDGSLKARACVAGRRLLYEFCDAHAVPYRVRQKLIVATSEDELSTLDSILQKAQAAGLDEAHGDALRKISAEEASELEPELQCTGALLSPRTGVIDIHAYVLALQGDAEANGAMVAFQTQVDRIESQTQGGFLVQTKESGDFEFDIVINCAGLGAVDVASARTSPPPEAIPRARFAKGNYFRLEGCKTPFEKLIYPVPEVGGLGVHITIDISGQARFGPDVQWLEGNQDPSAIDYTVDPSRGESFYASIRKYWPGLPDGSLAPDFSGVRPKLDVSGPQDFTILGPRRHGAKGLVHCLGIESPGLTSSLALANLVVDCALEDSSS
ncbi:L-2-hydroxyglutarate dehydrogenase, mitochondrial [Hondaea fermentalgiana]|uniref:L-2-hydroxyglutarate dehydrogenase, mitochondrial n=1 Tax=Hondaea fermentalgiana TaxID=2315210 RepID=A0A2R5GVR4_9STRA|nr:L-2-hydroxyglutarate dehydrogenase, mitochondrial [Hondaea fermentalgiana]|eukprot:GBG32501.1 L-2-hydroxyglutarate dehydrogenase, mitochondrial [Hondaea fermentalgiana]